MSRSTPDEPTDDRANRRLSPETLAAQALGKVDRETGALVPPLHASTTFERDPDGGYSTGRAYVRPHNPTHDDANELLARLEGGRRCLLFGSGMAAATSLFQALLPGDHVVVPRVMYWALRKWLIDFAMPWGLEADFVDATDLDAVRAAVRRGRTRLIWIETPANPTWSITDIAGVAQIAHEAQAKLAVDSTVPTPVLTRPIEHGADLVVHSATKYLNGHSDVLAGAVITEREDAYWQRVRAWHRDGGAVLGAFEAWLLTRGMRTLFVRVRQASESAMRVAEMLHAHPAVSHTLYPGLPDHPGHALASRQMTGGFGGMLSFRVAGGEAAAMAVAARVAVFTRATSLGGPESLIEHRASIEGPASPVPADLLRLSIGLEAASDLIADLEQALDCEPARAGIGAGGGVGETGGVAPGAGTAGTEPGGAASLEERVRAIVERQLAPIVVERGGELSFESCADAVAVIATGGSPGAVKPIEHELRATLEHYVPELEGVRFVPRAPDDADLADDAPAASAGRFGSLLTLIEREINPSVARHGGRIVAERLEGGILFVRFEGRCQGCAMADVTLRQGLEPILRERVGADIAVVDVTDHPAGREPYFKTAKS